MAAVFNTDNQGIAEARARILQNREVIIIPASYRTHWDDCDADSDSYDDDADCLCD